MFILGIVFSVTGTIAAGIVLSIFGMLGVAGGGILLATPISEALEHSCRAGFCPCTESGYRELEVGLRKKCIEKSQTASK